MGNGYSKWYVGGSYAEYDSLLVKWAEKEGYRLDYMTQHDLHFGTVNLDDYRAVVIAGHDEYWSTPMRDAIDAYVDRGGRVARFGGNFFWQIRLEEEGNTRFHTSSWPMNRTRYGMTLKKSTCLPVCGMTGYWVARVRSPWV